MILVVACSWYGSLFLEGRLPKSFPNSTSVLIQLWIQQTNIQRMLK